MKLRFTYFTPDSTLPLVFAQAAFEARAWCKRLVARLSDANVMATLAPFFALDLCARDGCVNISESHSRHDDQEASWPLQRRVPPCAANRCTCPLRTRTVMLSPTSGSRSFETDAIMRLRPPTSK